MNKNFIAKRVLLLFTLTCSTIQAGSPLWTFTPLTETTISISPNSTATVQYNITNQSRKTHTLVMREIPGITQITSGGGICTNPFTLAYNTSCVLSLSIDSELLTQSVVDGPVVCAQNSLMQCYRPSYSNVIRVTRVTSPSATISLSGSPLSLSTNGSPGSITVTNTSSSITALNIMSEFTGTGLDGNVTESGNTCATLAPLASCTLTYVPGSSGVAQTNFNINGSNTNTVTGAIEITEGPTLSGISPSSSLDSGCIMVTITGTDLLGTTDITFGGSAASNINIINSTTVTATNPAHAAGTVDVVVATGQGSSTLINGFTYLALGLGKNYGDRIIGC